MATSSSDFSCEAPADFHLSSSVEGSGSKLSSSSEKCLLCSNQRKTFYCKQCVQNGDFLHSTRQHERFAEKQMHLLHLNTQKREVKERCELQLKKHVLASQKRYEIDACKERIRLLRILVDETKENIATGESRTLVDMVKRNKNCSMRLPRYEEKVCKVESSASQKGTDAVRKRLAVQEVQDELKTVIRSSTQQLVDYIFPITRLQPISSPSVEEDCASVDTVSALADATRTAYVRGRWVFTDSSGELHHCIVAPTLPGSGDYSAYNVWVAANKDCVPGGNSDVVDHNPAYNISAALTYTTQLVNVIAFYLDIRLPNKLCYSDFCGHEMTDHQFARRVARLNSNVLHLCFSQNINPELLQPFQTLHNILQLIDPNVSDLGRQGQVEIDPILAKSLDDQLARDMEISDDSGSEDESDNLPWEWEAVPHVSCPESAAGSSSLASQHNLMSTQTTSMAGGLVTSAAAGLASIWRGWTGNK